MLSDPSLTSAPGVAAEAQAPQVRVLMLNRRMGYGHGPTLLQGYSGATWSKVPSRWNDKYKGHVVELTLAAYDACREDVFKAAHLAMRCWEPVFVVIEDRSSEMGDRGGETAAGAPPGLTDRYAPLKVSVRSAVLCIEIGVQTLEFCTVPENGGQLKGCAVDPTQADQFANDVANQIMRENEAGEAPIHRFLDEMIQAAADNGSAAVIFPKRELRKVRTGGDADASRREACATQGITSAATVLAVTCGPVVDISAAATIGAVSSGPVSEPAPAQVIRPVVEVTEKMPFPKLKKIALEEGVDISGVNNCAALVKAITEARKALVAKQQALIASKPAGGQA